MKIIETKFSTQKNKNKKSAPNYSSWDALTQTKFLFDLHHQLGKKISISEAYKVAVFAIQQD